MLGLPCWVPALVVASRGYSLLWCVGLSLQWLLLLWSTSSRATGLVVPRHVASSPTKDRAHVPAFSVRVSLCLLCFLVSWTHIFLSTWHPKLFTRCLSLLVVYGRDCIFLIFVSVPVSGTMPDSTKAPKTFAAVSVFYAPPRECQYNLSLNKGSGNMLRLDECL